MSTSENKEQDQQYMVFSIPTPQDKDHSQPLHIKLRHATKADDNQGEHETNTGFIMWPSAVLLSHHLVHHPELWRSSGSVNETHGSNICELGSGCGLTGLTTAALLQRESMDDKVVFTDYNPAVLENLKHNIQLNNFCVQHEVRGLDWFDQQPEQSQSQSTDDSEKEEPEDTRTQDENVWLDMDGTKQRQFRLVLGADLLVCGNDAELVAHTIDSTLAEGGKAVILGPSAGARFGVSEFPDACRSLGMNVKINEDVLESLNEVDNQEGIGNGQSIQELMSALKLGGHGQRASTAYGHDFTMFTIDKPTAGASA